MKFKTRIEKEDWNLLIGIICSLIFFTTLVFGSFEYGIKLGVLQMVSCNQNPSPINKIPYDTSTFNKEDWKYFTIDILAIQFEGNNGTISCLY